MPIDRTPSGLQLKVMLGIFVGFAALALLGLAWTRDDQRIAVLWLPNALLVAILLQSDRRSLVPGLLVGWAANIAAGTIMGIPSWRPITYGMINIVEATIVMLGMRRGDTRADFADVATLARFSLIAGIVAPLISATLSSGTTYASIGSVNARMFITWAMSHGLGLLIATPLFVIVGEGWRARRRLRLRDVREAAVILTAGFAVTCAIFAQSSFPILFLACPIVLIAAFRLGMIGTALTIAMISVVASVATIFGSGPMTLMQGSFATKLLILQVFLATNFALGLPVTAMLRGLHRTRGELRESRDFASTMLENMREVIFRTDHDGRWVFLNPAWEALTGYTVVESLGWRTTKLLLPEDRAEAAKVYPRLVAGEIDECILKQRFHSADGECHHIEVSVRALRDADARFAGTIGNIRDVSEQYRAEQAMRESERRFQTLAALAPVGIYRADRDGNATYFNAAWCRLTGLDEQQGMGMGWLAAIPPEDRVRVAIAWKDEGTTDRGNRNEFQFLREDGERAWVETFSAPELDEQEEMVGHIGIQVDITERKLAEQTAAEREALLELLASNATDAVFRIGLDGMCLYASPSVGEVIGTAPGSLIGRNVLTRFHPDDADRVVAAHRALASGEVERLVVSYRSEPMDRPGEWVWLEANSALVRDLQTGAPQEVIASIRDISTHKALELELAAARDAANVAAAAKASFLANMSHEIRTPMNGVIGFTELLLAGDLTAEQRDQVQLVADSGRAMMRLLNDILDISKIDAGQMQIARDPIDLRHALQGCMTLMGPLALEKKLKFDFQFDDAIPARLIGDGLRIRQIVLNLIGNALKFTTRGSVRLLASPIDGGSRIEIEVRDTGIGIAPDRQAAIFEQFVQSDATTARKYGGTGLGLAISSRLASLMGGELTVASEAGAGTSFFLRFPLDVVGTAAKRGSARAVGLPAPARRAAGASPRVLLAEDNEINKLLTTAMLERLGYRVAVAADGAQAVAQVDRAIADDDRFALVLMDVQMPEVDGIQATRLIRARGIDAAALPILALTANAFADDVVACLAAGMQAHLAKPLQMADLAAVLAEWTGEGRVSAEAARKRSS